MSLKAIIFNIHNVAIGKEFWRTWKSYLRIDYWPSALNEDLTKININTKFKSNDAKAMRSNGS